VHAFFSRWLLCGYMKSITGATVPVTQLCAHAVVAICCLQVGFGSGFKCNSAVWLCLNNPPVKKVDEALIEKVVAPKRLAAGACLGASAAPTAIATGQTAVPAAGRPESATESSEPKKVK
jgi:F0F1-type ATP synthase membrane subunit c/vacuolar-type H+-ATPase subunit K